MTIVKVPGSDAGLSWTLASNTNNNITFASHPSSQCKVFVQVKHTAFNTHLSHYISTDKVKECIHTVLNQNVLDNKVDRV